MFIIVAAESSEKLSLPFLHEGLWLNNILQDSSGKFPNNAEITHFCCNGTRVITAILQLWDKNHREKNEKNFLIDNKYSSKMTVQNRSFPLETVFSLSFV